MPAPRQLGFFDLTMRYEGLSQKGDPLEHLAGQVPWEAFRPTLLKGLRRSKRRKGGRSPFDAVLMFKILVLQALYNLSDDQTEYQIRDRLSFMQFLGLDLHQPIPDAKTIGSFVKRWPRQESSRHCLLNLRPIWRRKAFSPAEGRSLMRP